MSPQTRWSLALATVFAIALHFASQSAPAADAKPKRPNVILIMADDLGRECLGCYGSLSCKTPNLDALAAGGIRFENAFSTPLCSPSRAALMTGRYGFRTGWTNLIGRGGEDALEFFDPDKEKTFGHMLHAAGYTTGIAGKWQLARFSDRPNHMAECGFDNYCMWTWQFGDQKTSRYWDPSIWQDGKVRADTAGKYGPDVKADWVDGFLERNAATATKGKPFFLYYPMVLTHGPFDPTPDSRKAGAPAGKKGGRKRAAAAAKGEADAAAKPDAKAAPKAGAVEAGDADGQVSEFTAMVAYMDKTVGRVIATIRRLGLEQDTLIIFTGDNGTPKQVVTRLATPAGERKVQGGKGGMSDTGSHVPFIASWKGTTPAGKVSDQLIDFTDVLPTLADLAGTSPPAGIVIDGHSFATTLRGQKGPEREWVHTQLGNRKWVRDKRWKLMGSGELYDLQNDPWEERPVPPGTGGEAAAARERLASVMAKLK